MAYRLGAHLLAEVTAAAHELGATALAD